MSKKPNRNFDKDGKENNKIRNLQHTIKQQEKEIKALRSQVRTLEQAFKKSAAYMSKESKDLSVEELISAANKSQTLEQAKKAAPVVRAKPAPPTLEELDRKKQDAREKVKAWRDEKYGKYEEE